MDFTCAHCNKPIIGLSVVIDKEHILHAECKDGFLQNKLWAGFKPYHKNKITGTHKIRKRY